MYKPNYNPGKNYVDSKLYKLLYSHFHYSHRPHLPLFNVLSDKMSFAISNNLYTYVFMFNIG